MAITFRYDVPAAVSAAYATGQGRARQRRRKYLMDMLQRRRGRALGPDQQIVGWNDPLADDPGLDPGERRRRKSARRSRDRKGRLGRGVPTEWQPQAITQADIDLKRKKDEEDRADQRKREAEARDELRRKKGADAARQQEITDEDLARRQDLIDARRKSIRDRLKDEDFSESQRSDVENLWSQIDKVRRDTKLSEEEREKKIAELMGEVDDIINNPEGSSELTRDEKLESAFGRSWEKYKDLPWIFNEKGIPSLPTGFKMPDPAAEAAKQQTELKTELKAAVKEEEGLRDKWMAALDAWEDAKEKKEAEGEYSEVTEGKIARLYETVVRTKGRLGKAIEERQEFEKQAAAQSEPETSYDLATTQAEPTLLVGPWREADEEPDGPAPTGGVFAGGAGEDIDPAMAEAVSGALAQQRAAEDPDPVLQTPIHESLRVHIPGSRWDRVDADHWVLANPEILTPEKESELRQAIAKQTAQAAEDTGGPRLDLDKLRPQHFYDGQLHDEPRPQATAEEFDRQWKRLKPGESLRGPDGRIYIKRK